MSVLNYLVTSNARRGLLEVLWKEDYKGSVSELARLSGVAFSTAQRELTEMANSGLARYEHVGNATIYRANTEHPDGDLILRLLSEETLTKEPERLCDARESRHILAHLKAIGAPLRGTPARRLEIFSRASQDRTPAGLQILILPLSHANGSSE